MERTPAQTHTDFKRIVIFIASRPALLAPLLAFGSSFLHRLLQEFLRAHQVSVNLRLLFGIQGYG